MRRILLALVCVMVLAAAARGQDDFINETAPVSMPFTGRSLSEYMKTVGFSPEQMGAARTLHEGYRAAYSAAAAKAKKRWSELQEQSSKNNDWAAYAAGRAKAAEEFVEKARAAETGLLSDLKLLATPEQAAKVASAERARRRETGFRFALGLGERVDLWALLRDEKIAPDSSPAMADLVSRWELNVDRLLIEKDRLLMEGMKEIMGQEGKPGFEEKAGKFFADLAGMSARVGEANRRAAAEALLLVPEDKRAGMERAIKVMTFPRIYGPSGVEKAMGEALKWKDLGDDQREKVKEMQGAYARAAEPINARWASGADRMSREFAKRPMEMMKRSMSEGDPNDPYVSARRDRLALDKQYQEKLEALLSEGQKEHLPKAEEHPGGIPEYLPDFEADVRADWKQWKDEGNDGG